MIKGDEIINNFDKLFKT